MKKIRYSPDVDAMLIEICDRPIAYAEDEGQIILHYSSSGELVLIEILDVKQFISLESVSDQIPAR
ncbi:DUF2283 domain-containing protein [Microcoleus sp. A2-C5]|uniref:DUF2283 domain-containing protein n=1 Tax=Microcoleaceae TaxID=1892252 RepID=UPI002237840A|nr:DUF2283 domain-containing protein [Lyngbya sp. CCAP 1446/10]MCW6048559.1 DUF2283 domain-containing protein [Lyngbya sp. CCAP 1446/10]